MTASLPAIQQPSPRAHSPHGRSGSAQEGDTQGFGKLLKSGDSVPKNQAFGLRRADAGTDAGADTGKDAGTAELALDLDVLKDDLSAPTDGTEVSPDAAVTEESLADDTPDGAETLLPLLAPVEFRNPTGTQPGTPEPAPGAADNGAAPLTGKELPPRRIMDEPAAQRQQGRLPAIVEQSDAALPGEPTQTAFGKSLIASLNALATQAPDRSAQGERMRTAPMADDISAEPLPAARENAGRRNRGTIVPEAVTRAMEARETSDRRAEARSMTAAEQKIAATPSALLSTGAPVVEAVAAAPRPSAALHRAAGAEIANHGAPATMQALKIQLHPVELGKVTANLRMAGEQLSVEIEVETAEAYNKLSSETEAIARALRSHGIAVDEVVIQAPQAQSATSTRDGGGSFAGTSDGGRNFSGSAEFGQSGGSGYPNRDPGHDNGHESEAVLPGEKRTNGGSPGHGVYI